MNLYWIPLILIILYLLIGLFLYISTLYKSLDKDVKKPLWPIIFFWPFYSVNVDDKINDCGCY